MNGRQGQLEAEFAEAQQVLHEASARVVGIRAELQALAAGDVRLNDLGQGSRTDAIEEILRRHAGSMWTKDIRAALVEPGRPTSMNEVTATLHHLVKSRGTVHCVARRGE